MEVSSTTCRLCGGQDLRPMYTLGNAGEFRYHRCERCRLVNYDLRGGLDQTKYEAEWTDPRQESPRFTKTDQTYEFLVRRGIPPGRILDIGAGSGRILARAQADGWEVAGIELSHPMATRTSQALGATVLAMDFLEGDLEPLGTFDVVVLAHVLEHLPDPVRAMERIRSLLVPGGLAVLEFPNIDAPDLRWKRALTRARLRRPHHPEGWRPGHCQEFCRASFEYLARRTGFRLEHWETYSKRAARSGLYRRLGLGNKARALVQRKD